MDNTSAVLNVRNDIKTIRSYLSFTFYILLLTIICPILYISESLINIIIK